MIDVVHYNLAMEITNTSQLTRVTSSKYLEVFVPKTGPLVAIQWHQVKPRNLPKKHSLVQFK